MLPKASFRAFVASLIGACLLAGCMSPFARFYDPAASSHAGAAAAQGAPRFQWSRNPDGDGQQLAQQGYVLIGTSSFIGAGFTYDGYYKVQAVTQGASLGAALVLLDADYNNVVSDGCCVRVFASYWAQGSARADARSAPGASGE